MISTSTSVRPMVEAYIEALTTGGDFGQYFTDDVSCEMVGTDIQAYGREAVTAFVRAAHFEMFDSTVEFVSVLVDEDRRRGACEIVFRGRHIGEFAGIAATGREVEVPYSVHYDFTDDGISALRGYALVQGLIGALSS